MLAAQQGGVLSALTRTNSAALLYGVAEFRENASLTDMEKIKQCVATAELSLSQLQKYG